MVKATDTKSSAKPAHGQQSRQPFFNKEGSSAMDHEQSAESETPTPFFVQRKLTIGKPDDHFEKEADAVADKVVQRMSQPGAEPVVQAKQAQAPAPPAITALPAAPVKAAAPQESLQKKEETEGKEDEEIVQRKPIFDSMADPPEERVQRKPIFDSMADAQEEAVQRKEQEATPGTASDGVQQRLKDSKGGGQPLPSETRNAMESSIGADFSGVRIHTGHNAAALSNDLGAQAFTHGNDIYFNEGKYDPSGNSGRHLLAHELAHTVQQGAAIRRKIDTATAPADMIQKSGPSSPAPAKGKAAAGSGEIVNVAGGTFLPSARLKEAIEAAGDKGLEVNVSGGQYAETGTIKVYEKDGDYFSKGMGYMPLKVPLLKPANPMLAVKIQKGKVSGFSTVGRSTSKNSIPQFLRNSGKELKWLNGIESKGGGDATNSFEGGTLTFWLNGMKVKVGKFADATLNLGYTNMKMVANVAADINVTGMTRGNLDITLKDDTLFGQGEFEVKFKNFTGNIAARFAEGMLDVKGSVGYAGDKLSGSLTLIMTDKATADSLAVDTVKAGGGEAATTALPEGGVPPAADKAGPRALAGMGTLTFNLTEWFAGSVNVIVDGQGEVTVIGKIAPPKEIILFDQKDYTKELFKFEARAPYGIPVIGNVYVFANIGLSALAKVGPAKIYDIEVTGTYSTRADVAKSITLAGSLNISAYAGLRLRAEGGAGVEIADHDLKVGVGVNADAGVKGYIDARPTIGYRDPGEFFFKGHMEIAAQPFLGLSGDLFVEVDSPWWSPLPDKKWTWPIGALEYPLPGQFGIGADLEYVLGSGKVPDIKFGEAKFDGEKFMTDLVAENVPKKGGADKGDKQGKFTDGGAGNAAPPAGGPGAAAPAKGGGKPAPGGKGDAPKAAAPKAGGKGGKGGKGKDKKGEDKIEDAKNFAEAMKAVKSLEQRTKPMARDEITAAVEGIKKRFRIRTISVTPQGTEWWIVTGTLKNMPNKQSVKVRANMKPGDEKDKKNDPKEKEKQKRLDLAIRELTEKDDRVAGDGKISKEEAQKLARDIKAKHSIFASLTVIDAKTRWDYYYVQRAPSAGAIKGVIKDEIKLPAGLKYGDLVRYDPRTAAGRSDKNVYTIHSVNKDSLNIYLAKETGETKPLPFETFKKQYADKVIKKTRRQKSKLPPMPLCRLIFKTRRGKNFDEFNRQIVLQERHANATKIGYWIDHKKSFETRKKTSPDKEGRDPRSEGAQKQARIDEKRRIAALEKARLTAEFRKANRRKPLPGPEENRIKKKADAYAEKMAEGTAALHGPDQAGGGHYAALHGLGRLRVNSSIGSQWVKRFESEHRAEKSDTLARDKKLLKHVEDFRKKENLTKDDLKKINMNVEFLIQIRTK